MQRLTANACGAARGSGGAAHRGHVRQSSLHPARLLHEGSSLPPRLLPLRARCASCTPKWRRAVLLDAHSVLIYVPFVPPGQQTAAVVAAAVAAAVAVGVGCVVVRVLAAAPFSRRFSCHFSLAFLLTFLLTFSSHFFHFRSLGSDRYWSWRCSWRWAWRWASGCVLAQALAPAPFSRRFSAKSVALPRHS